MTKEGTREDRLRAALPTKQPILGARCPDAQRRLFDFSIDPTATDGVLEAAEEVLACVQDELRRRRPRLDSPAVFELVHARLWAILALSVLTGSHAHAKRHELAVTAGAPLTACFGYSPFMACFGNSPFMATVHLRTLQRVQPYGHGVLRIPAYGCFAVIEESTRLGARMWRQWCPECAPNSGQAARKQARAHRRMVDRALVPPLPLG